MTNSFELLQYLRILWHEEKVISIVIPDYVRTIDRYIILTYTEKQRDDSREDDGSVIPRGAGIIIVSRRNPSRLLVGGLSLFGFIRMDS